MRKSLIILILLILIVLSTVIINNNKINNKMNIPPNVFNAKVKIVAPQEIVVRSDQYEYLAPNNFDKPSLVIAKKNNKIIWENELAVPQINVNLEKDVQLLDYLVTEIKIGEFQSQDALYVTLGNSINAKTYILNVSNGELLDFNY